MMPSDQAFEHYRQDAAFSARGPDLDNKRSNDELEAITEAEGKLDMPVSPALGIRQGEPATSRANPGTNKYLWVVGCQDVPIAIEDNRDIRTRPSRGRLSHTNLTGGADAHAGGEVWFISADAVCINGGSSRYRPRSADELRAIARGLARMGYRVGNLGMDETNMPVRVFKEGAVEWFSPNS